MKYVSHKNSCHTGEVQIHVYTPLTPSIKINNETKAGKYFVNNKLRRGHISDK